MKKFLLTLMTTTGFSFFVSENSCANSHYFQEPGHNNSSKTKLHLAPKVVPYPAPLPKPIMIAPQKGEPHLSFMAGKSMAVPSQVGQLGKEIHLPNLSKKVKRSSEPKNKDQSGQKRKHNHDQRHKTKDQSNYKGKDKQEHNNHKERQDHGHKNQPDHEHNHQHKNRQDHKRVNSHYYKQNYKQGNSSAAKHSNSLNHKHKDHSRKKHRHLASFEKNMTPTQKAFYHLQRHNIKNQETINNLSLRVMDPTLPEDLRKVMQDTLDAAKQDMVLTNQKRIELENRTLDLHHVKINGIPVVSIKPIEYENPVSAASLYQKKPELVTSSVQQKVNPGVAANNSATEENED